jgi:hypothetical protein
MSLSSFLLVSSDEGQWVLELGCCTANAGPDLDYLRGDALPPSPWPKPRDKQSWSGVTVQQTRRREIISVGMHTRALGFPGKGEQGGAPPHQEINSEQKSRGERQECPEALQGEATKTFINSYSHLYTGSSLLASTHPEHSSCLTFVTFFLSSALRYVPVGPRCS